MGSKLCPGPALMGPISAAQVMTFDKVCRSADGRHTKDLPRTWSSGPWWGATLGPFHLPLPTYDGPLLRRGETSPAHLCSALPSSAAMLFPPTSVYKELFPQPPPQKCPQWQFHWTSTVVDPQAPPHCLSAQRAVSGFSPAGEQP